MKVLIGQCIMFNQDSVGDEFALICGHYRIEDMTMEDYYKWADKTTDAWRKDDGAFIPAPLVYLNQQRWDGAEIPEGFGIKVESQIDPALAKIDADRKKATPMPEHIRARLAELRK